MNYKNRKGEPISNRTQILKLIVIRKFFSFLVKQDLIIKNPASYTTLPKEEQKLTRNILTEKEVMNLLENLKLTNPVSIRNRAIVELFYGCGVRTTELCNLKVHDVDLKEQTVIIVKGKYLSCYSFRRSIASHLLAGNVDITYIAKLLGHSSLRTTQRYLRVEIGDLKKMHSFYHPRERNR